MRADAGPAPGCRERLAGSLPPRGLRWLLLGAVVLYALQAAYSDDLAKAAENVVFFYVPFALLFVLLRDVRWTPRAAAAVPRRRRRAGRRSSPASASSSTHRKELFFNPKLVAANQYDNYFRVNSLFFDPNIYGRFLALVMIARRRPSCCGARRRATC